MCRGWKLTNTFLIFLLGKDRGQIARKTKDQKEEQGESGKLHGAEDRDSTPGAASHESHWYVIGHEAGSSAPSLPPLSSIIPLTQACQAAKTVGCSFGRRIKETLISVLSLRHFGQQRISIYSVTGLCSAVIRPWQQSKQKSSTVEI